MDWHQNFDERQLNEICFALLYLTAFGHGTDGHNRLMIIAKMAELLDKKENDEKALSISPIPFTT